MYTKGVTGYWIHFVSTAIDQIVRVFLARNTGKIKTLEVDGITSQSIEPIEVASCKVGPVSSTGVYKGYCWYSNSQASLQPFYTYILTSGGPLMESFVWTTLMAGAWLYIMSFISSEHVYF